MQKKIAFLLLQIFSHKKNLKNVHVRDLFLYWSQNARSIKNESLSKLYVGKKHKTY